MVLPRDRACAAQPADLLRPISRRGQRLPISRRGQRPAYTLPRSFLDVKIDGRQTFFEWISAGRYARQNERGTMAQVTQGPIKEVYFGFNLEALLVRVDFDTPARAALADYDALRLGFVEPAGWELLVEKPAATTPQVRVIHEGLELKTRPGAGVYRIPAVRRSVCFESWLYCHRAATAHASEILPSAPTRMSEEAAERGDSFKTTCWFWK